MMHGHRARQWLGGAILTALVLGVVLLLVQILRLDTALGPDEGSTPLPSIVTLAWFVTGLLFFLAIVYWDRFTPWAHRMTEGDLGRSDSIAIGITVAVLVVIGFVLRAASMNTYGFNPDEGFFVCISMAESFADVWNIVRIESPHPPGYFYLMHVWGMFSHGVGWMRLPSVIAGTFSIWISYRFARAMFTPIAGVMMATLVTFSPNIIDVSRVSRNYTVGLALMLTAAYCFVHFFQQLRWKWMAAYALLASCSLLIMYNTLIPIVALSGVLLAELLFRRAPMADFGKAALTHVPLGATGLLLYWKHIAPLPKDQVDFHQSLYRSSTTIDFANLFRPVLETLHFLLPNPVVPAVATVISVGIVAMLIQRKRLALAILLAPIVVAYGFMMLQLMPFGDSRHTIYLYLFLFGIFVSQVPEILTGYQAVRVHLANWPADFRAWRTKANPASASSSGNVDAGRPSVPRALNRAGFAAPAGALALLLAASTYASLSLGEYAEGASIDLPENLLGRANREFLTYYRQADVERAQTLLEGRADPGDIVVLTLAGLFSFLPMHELTPTFNPTPEQIRNRDLRNFYAPQDGPFRHTHNGVRYYYSAEYNRTLLPTFGNFLSAVNSIQTEFDLERPRKVWLLIGGWEFPPTTLFGAQYPNYPLDREIHELSNGLLLGIDGEVYARAARALGIVDTPTP